MSPLFLAAPLAGQGLLEAALLARLHVVGVALDLFDDVLLLNFTLESSQRSIEGLAILKDYFSQLVMHLPFTE